MNKTFKIFVIAVIFGTVITFITSFYSHDSFNKDCKETFTSARNLIPEGPDAESGRVFECTEAVHRGVPFGYLTTPEHQFKDVEIAVPEAGKDVIVWSTPIFIILLILNRRKK